VDSGVEVMVVSNDTTPTLTATATAATDARAEGEEGAQYGPRDGYLCDRNASDESVVNAVVGSDAAVYGFEETLGHRFSLFSALLLRQLQYTRLEGEVSATQDLLIPFIFGSAVQLFVKCVQTISGEFGCDCDETSRSQYSFLKLFPLSSASIEWIDGE